MIVFPNAKINLGLYVTEKRPDGYHNLETFFYPVHGLTDLLEVVPNPAAKEDTFNITGIQLDGEINENIVLKALLLLREKHTIPLLDIHLHKTIPAGSGLGGGSADAAFMLKLLNSLFSLNIPSGELESLAAQLGADCAFFIENKPSLARGIGNLLTPVPIHLKGLWLLLVVAPVHVSTPQAYQSVTPKQPENPLRESLFSEMQEWPRLIINDFEKPLFESHPELLEIKTRMYAHKARYASLSGSGSAIFGLFEEKPNIQWPANTFSWVGQLK